MEEAFAIVIALIAITFPFIAIAALFILPSLLMTAGFGVFAAILVRALNPDPEKKLPGPLQNYLEFKSRKVKETPANLLKPAALFSSVGLDAIEPALA